MEEFTPEKLPRAIKSLLELNNYEVREDVHIYGAQIDLIAKSKSDPFSPTMYIEATVEYVNTIKYGKDVTKFILVQQQDPGGICVCVSSAGFTADVVERASASRIKTMKFDELFKSFERFSSYTDHILGSAELTAFNQTYEEPYLMDLAGEHSATKWLEEWRDATSGGNNWLVLLGEYGTGKTALTKILQYRWLNAYTYAPNTPIPFRIELREFVKQFDARTLIHHFLDHNKLGHIPIDFVFYMIRSKRIVLILDGYDEMAQFLNVRERRACLAALADLASEGAKGIITSRPNYFDEAEELKVFEALYASLDNSKYYFGKSDVSYIRSEAAVDSLVERYILDRKERTLRDLNIAQTENLVRSKLSGDPIGQQTILRILRKIFRSSLEGDHHALSGKPVIISYLLELIDDLRGDNGFEADSLTEWQIYKMIVDRLMIRDHTRTPSLAPSQRRKCLQRLATTLSRRDIPVAEEQHFYEIIDEEFRPELRLMDSEDRLNRRRELFENLRSSATLTRTSLGKGQGWVFSHNSLREYLCCEFYVGKIDTKIPFDFRIPVTPAMRNFVAALSNEIITQHIDNIAAIWAERGANPTVGRYLSLYWDAIRKIGKDQGSVRDILSRIGGGHVALDQIKCDNISFDGKKYGDDLHKAKAYGAEFSEIRFSCLNMSASDFSQSILDTVDFSGTDLSNAIFDGALLYDCDFTETDVTGASFLSLDPDSSLIVRDSTKKTMVTYHGKPLIGYLRSRNGVTDHVDDYFVFMHKGNFSIVEKICAQITGQRNNQLRGLTQRGEAHLNPPFARAFVEFLERQGLVNVNQNELVSVTSDGRSVLLEITQNQRLPGAIKEFLEKSL